MRACVFLVERAQGVMVGLGTGAAILEFRIGDGHCVGARISETLGGLCGRVVMVRCYLSK